MSETTVDVRVGDVPKGYVRCITRDCKVWRHPNRVSKMCWPCWVRQTGWAPDGPAAAACPDWKPPTPEAKPAAPDRSRCKPWCGMNVSRGVGSDLYGDAPESIREGTAFCADPIDSFRWCSRRCHDERRPPLRSDDTGGKKEAAKANPAETAATAQKPRCGNNGCKTPFQNVAQRWCQSLDRSGRKTGAVLELSCEPCHLLDENDFLAPSKGTPLPADYKLPKPEQWVPSGDDEEWSVGT